MSKQVRHSSVGHRSGIRGVGQPPARHDVRMDPEQPIRPFRWNVARRSELGTLPADELPALPVGFEEELLEIAAKVVVRAGNSDLVCVGRSPEHLFDLLAGLLENSSWSGRLELLFASLWMTSSYEGLMARHAGQVPLMRHQLDSLRLGPTTISARPRPVALIDLVSEGGTFDVLIRLLEAWCRERDSDWDTVRKKLRIVGLTCRTHTSPNTWRWQQHADWRPLLAPNAIKNVSVSWPVYRAIGDTLPKTTRAFPPNRWGDESATAPERTDEARSALALAAHLHSWGTQRATRRRFARLLVDGPGGKERWVRALASEL